MCLHPCALPASRPTAADDVLFSSAQGRGGPWSMEWTSRAERANLPCRGTRAFRDVRRLSPLFPHPGPPSVRPRAERRGLDTDPKLGDPQCSSSGAFVYVRLRAGGAHCARRAPAVATLLRLASGVPLRSVGFLSSPAMAICAHEAS